MINYISHKNIDKIKWNSCVESDPHADVFFYSWFLDTVCTTWDALIAGDYEAVFPLPYKNRVGINYIIQPFFTRTLDVCSPDSAWKNPELFIEKIPARFKLQEFCFIPSKDISVNHFHEKKYQSLHLGLPFTDLKKNFSSNTLQNLKKSLRYKLKISDKVTTAEIADDFKNLKGKDLEKFDAEEYVILKKLMDQCLHHNKGYCRKALDENGNRIASAFFMHAHQRIIYLKGSTSEAGKKSGAMHLIISDIIEEFSNSDIIFDFGGSSIASLARFFKGFGASDHSYFAVKKNNLPVFLKWLK